MPTFDDELDDVVKPQPAKQAAPASTPAAATKAAAKPAVEDIEDDVPKQAAKPAAAPAEDEDLDVDFGDKKIMAKGDGLNRIRAEKNKVVRFALLDFIKPKSAKSHFVEAKDKKGTFRCLTKGDDLGYCCTKLGEDGQLHVVALALLYTNADASTGGLEKGVVPEWEIGYVDLSRSNFRSVSNLAPEESTPYDIDMVMAKKDNGIGYEFTLKSPKARWKMNPEVAAAVEAAAQKFVRDNGKKLIGKLGKVATLLEWKAMLSGVAAANAKEASLEDVEDL